MIILKVLGIIVLVALILWILTMVVYFFNLDMKATSLLYSLLEKHYDHVKRDKHL